jgi:hypothetical protein
VTEVRILLACAPARAREKALAQLRREGWRVREDPADSARSADSADGPNGTRGPDAADQPVPPAHLERGSLGRSVLLGGLARRGQHLALRVDVLPRPTGSVVVCSWSDVSPRALGGILGKRRAEREMRRTTEALSRALGG